MTARRQGGPPVEGREPQTLAEHLHVARKKAILYAAELSNGYKHVTARRLRISRPHLDKWIALYGIRENFRCNKPRA